MKWHHFWFAVAILFFAFAIYTGIFKPFKPPASHVDDLEVRITTTLRTELARERAYRLWPDLLDPQSDHARRYVLTGQQWLQDNDERIMAPDWPFILARETANL